MAAIIRDITIEQGGVLDETFLLKSNGVAIDLTGYTSTLIIKDNQGVIVHTATTENGQILINGPLGSVRRKISAQVTKTILKSDDTWKLYRGRCHVIEEGSRGS